MLSRLARSRSSFPAARRLFSVTAIVRNETPKSSCKAGTKLNLKVRKNGDEPVALEDTEYPDWLWDMLDKKKVDEKLKQDDFMRWRRKQLGNENSNKIKANNFLANMK
ncbi:ribosomal protein L54/L37-like protein [Scheffersomyces stipitis CBS 6054]|uniref:Large ribosomal subunit protein mL54 n=1 Tax=Scheffersomyces stipitis (strain ATCC 58785 / CBS 6054 / NBRC 10063 / NRRL Y-11545) TaxID=322104 RepID=A3GG18_PICST|nr:mitochondrial 54S ribosomal protein YmL37 [Scheffersomyces stipitis CBS 6054]EAZ63442.1 ribosomal protein L54/L37-like protein [Scheffersomyces stipitis CBS 6054]